MIEYAYLDTLKNFVEEEINSLVFKIQEGFKSVYQLMPSSSEIASWQNSLPKLQQILKKLLPKLESVRVFIELRMPFSSARADVFYWEKSYTICRDSY